MQHSSFPQQHGSLDQFFLWCLGALTESAQSSVAFWKRVAPHRNALQHSCSGQALHCASVHPTKKSLHSAFRCTPLCFGCINVSNPFTYLAVIRLEENHHSKGYITASGERIPNFDRKTVCTISASSKASHFEGTTNP